MSNGSKSPTRREMEGELDTIRAHREGDLRLAEERHTQVIGAIDTLTKSVKVAVDTISDHKDSCAVKDDVSTISGRVGALEKRVWYAAGVSAAIIFLAGTGYLVLG